MKEEAISIRGKRGELRGIRHPPAEPDGGWTAIVLQGFFSSTHVGPARLYVQIGRLLAEQGVEVIRMDCFGVGDSDGDFEAASYESQLEDYRTIVEEAGRRSPTRRIALVGHSLGSSMAIRLTAERRVVRRLILLSPSCGPFSHPENLFSTEQQAELKAQGETWRKSVLIRKAFVDAIESEAIYAIARRVEVSTLVFRGAADEYFDDASGQRLIESFPWARLVEIAEADHNFLAPGARRIFLRAFEEEIRELWKCSE